MSTLLEIESAADVLPQSQQQILLRHLAAKLELVPESPEKSATATNEAPAWPDFEARLRVIYGDRTMPSRCSLNARPLRGGEPSGRKGGDKSFAKYLSDHPEIPGADGAPAEQKTDDCNAPDYRRVCALLKTCNLPHFQ